MGRKHKKKKNKILYKSKTVSTSSKVDLTKKPEKDLLTVNKQTSILRAAPYTVLMVAALCGFWSYKATKAICENVVNSQTESAEDIQVHVDPTLSELAEIETSLGAPTVSDDGTDGNGSGESGSEEVNNSGNAGEEDNSGTNSSDGVQTDFLGNTDTDNVSESSDGNSEVNTNENGDEKTGGEEGNNEANKTEDNLAHIPTEDELKAYPYIFGEIEGNYVTYKAKEVDSRYYSDAGRIALDTPADYINVDDTYFDDACFIGDSRMVGIFDYSGWDNADFYCDNGYCVYSYQTGKTVCCQNNGKKYTLEDAMKRKSYGKIYIMIGTNDSGYGNTESFQENYSLMLDMIREKQPEATIFLVSNLRISAKAEKEDKTGVYNNININDKNVAISELADGDKVFFFDCNIPFVDKKGYLIQDYTFDGFHLYAQQYVELTELFKAHGMAAKDGE